MFGFILCSSVAPLKLLPVLKTSVLARWADLNQELITSKKSYLLSVWQSLPHKVEIKRDLVTYGFSSPRQAWFILMSTNLQTTSSFTRKQLWLGFRLNQKTFSKESTNKAVWNHLCLKSFYREMSFVDFSAEDMEKNLIKINWYFIISMTGLKYL